MQLSLNHTDIYKCHRLGRIVTNRPQLINSHSTRGKVLLKPVNGPQKPAGDFPNEDLPLPMKKERAFLRQAANMQNRSQQAWSSSHGSLQYIELGYLVDFEFNVSNLGTWVLNLDACRNLTTSPGPYAVSPMYWPPPPIPLSAAVLTAHPSC